MKRTRITSNGPKSRGNKTKKDGEEYGKKCVIDLFAIDLKKEEGPGSFHVGRAANCNFRIILDPPEIPLSENPVMKDKTPIQRGNLGTFVLKGKDMNVTPTDFYRFVFAASQILHTTNYLNKDPSLDEKPEIPVKPKKGQSREEIEKAQEARREKAAERARSVTVSANKTIVFRLNDCAKLMYGVEKPSTEQRKRAQTLIEFLHYNPVVIKDPNGKIRLSFLSTMQDIEVEYDNGPKPIMYALNLNPIFVYEWATNFCELPRDIMARINNATKKTTEAHFAMLTLLSRQNRKVPFHRTMAQLVKDLALTDEYTAKRGLTEQKILGICDTFKEVKMLSGYHTTKNGEWIEKISFYFDNGFIERALNAPQNEENNEKEG